jgi:inhibitor of cysteine peptidase
MNMELFPYIQRTIHKSDNIQRRISEMKLLKPFLIPSIMLVLLLISCSSPSLPDTPVEPTPFPTRIDEIAPELSPDAPDQPVSSDNDSSATSETDNDVPSNGNDMTKGNIYISETQLLVMESYPIQVTINITGELPTPCHKFQAEVSPPDESNQITVTVYSLQPPDDVMCTQVLEPFSENIPIPLDGFSDGIYTVLVNNEQIGQFNYPGG